MIDVNSGMDDIQDFIFHSDDTTPKAETTPLNQGATDEAQQEAPNQASTQQEAGNTQATGEASTQGDNGDYSHFSFAEACRTAKAQAYLIHNEVKTKGLHMTYGEPASGKTFYVIDKAASVACEDIKSWHGKPIRHGQVVYFAGEASEGVKLRCKGWAIKRGINPENVNLVIFDEVFCLDDEKDTEHTINKTIQQIRKYAPKAVYILFDTLHAFMSGDENLAVDTNKFLKVCRTLISTFDCAVELIHHVGVSENAKKRGRGSSAWKGAMDIETLVETLASTDTSITCRMSQNKHKDGKKHKLVFNMEEVILPGLFDEAGYAITTLVPEIDEATTNTITTSEPKEPAKPNLGKAQQFAMDSFREAAKLHGEIITDNPNTGHETIRLDDSLWRNYFIETLPRKEECKTEEDKKKDMKSKKSRYSQAKEYMILKAHILTIQHEGSKEHYCLDLSSDKTDAAYRLEIRTGIKNREKAEAEKSAKANEASEAGEAERTETLFKDNC